jgi:hypothetical protein
MKAWGSISCLCGLIIWAGCVGAWRPPGSVLSNASGSLGDQVESDLSYGAALASPSELRVGAAYSLGDRRREGKDFDTSLPHQRVSAVGANCEFAAIGEGADEIAYAIFSFSLPAYVDGPELHLRWNELPAPPPGPPPQTAYWIGLANFETNRWDWFAGPDDGVLELDLPNGSSNLAPYRRPSDGAIFCAVVSRGSGGDLGGVRFGNPGWLHTWVGPEPLDGDNNTMFDLAVDAEGNVYGEMISTSFDDATDMYSGVLKYDSEGRLLWQRFLNAQLFFPDIALDPDGNLLVAVSDTYSKFHLFKLSQAGEVIWQRAFEHAGDPRPWRAWVAVDGDTIHTGFRLRDSFDMPSGCTILRYSSSGTLMMAKDLGVPEAAVCQSICAVDGATYIAGNPSLIKVDGSGSIAWQKWVYDIPGHRAQCCFGLDGNLYVADQDYSHDTPVVVSFDPDGARRWCRGYSSVGGIDSCYTLAAAPFGVALAIATGTGAAALIRLDYDGGILGCDAYALIADQYTLLGNFAFDSAGRLYATGICYSGGQALNNWSQASGGSDELDSSMVDGSATITDSTGAEINSELDWSDAGGIEDDTVVDGLGVELGFILRRED